MSVIRKCMAWLLRDTDFEREAYLSKASDIADLERRLRDWERHPQGLFR